MSTLPLHPKVVHLPMALAVLIPLLSAGLLTAWWKGWLERRAWLVVVLLQALLVGSGVLALRTGEDEEERVEQVVPEQALEHHEEAAETFVIGAGVVLLVVGAAALVPAEGPALAVGIVGLAGSLLVLGLGVRVGEAGGRLVYEHGAARAYTVVGPGSSISASPALHHDDD